MIARKWRDDDESLRGSGWLSHVTALQLLHVLIWVIFPAVARAQPINWTCKPGQTAVWTTGSDGNPAPGCQGGKVSLTGVAPYPGFWHANSVAIPHYAPCPATGLQPYTHFTDPDTGNEGYFRYDFSSYRWPITTCPGGNTVPCQFASGGGPCHCDTWGDVSNYEIPIWNPSPGAGADYFPVPAPLGGIQTALCAEWLAAGNTATCPGTENYPNAMRNNGIYNAGYQLKLPVINADPGCQTGAVTATPTRTVTPTPTATRTPTPAPNQFQDWIYQAVAEKLMAGTGPTTFSPGDNALTWQGIVTRGQQAVYLLKMVHQCDTGCPVYVPPPCTPPGKFTDVPCVH